MKENREGITTQDEFRGSIYLGTSQGKMVRRVGGKSLEETQSKPQHCDGWG
jgi:hypothetical protein